MHPQEVNFDGIVGPTHNFAGLSHGNVASMRHGGSVSHPREAALQGLAKMKALADLGVPQAMLPPQERPDIGALRAFGFSGTEREILRAAAKQAPALLAACSSASAMWVANAATVSPSADTADGRVHFTPANLAAKLHRSLEPPQTTRTLRAIFRDADKFVVHDPIPGHGGMGDEGAANHLRFDEPFGRPGINIFVYGHRALDSAKQRGPKRFASRQSLEAAGAIARRHGIRASRTMFIPQNPATIDAGAFHNDVVAVSHERILFCHEHAFAGGTRRVVAQIDDLQSRMHQGAGIVPLIVPARRVSLATTVRTYLFNSQIVTLGDGSRALIAPTEVQRDPIVHELVHELICPAGFHQVHYFDLRQSMDNGGGPACLRLRVKLTALEHVALPRGIWLNQETYPRLVAWVKANYRENLTARDLADPKLLDESRRALDRLTQLLGLGSIYPFQQAHAIGWNR